MKPNDKACEALADRLQHHGCHHGWFPKGLPSDWRELDPIGRDEFLAIADDLANAAFAAQFQSEDYAGLVERLRKTSGMYQGNAEKEGNFLPIATRLKNPDGPEAADALEALLAERDALKAELASAHTWIQMRATVFEELAMLRTERDALLARLAPVDDEALVEIAVNEMRKQLPASGVMYIHIANAARNAIAAIRPHIEAAERERCAKVAESHSYPMKTVAGTGYNNAAKEIAAAIRSGK